MITLVTGATGLVGNNVVRLLLEQGRAVRVLARESSDPRPLEGLDVETVRGDVRDAESVVRAADGVARVIHAAAMVHVGWTGLDQQRAVNVEGTRNVCAAADKFAARMVHVSSVDALGPGTIENPGDEDSPAGSGVPCPYVITKGEAQQVVLQHVEQGLDAVIVNPAFMLGPWDWKPSSGRMLLAVAKQRPWIAPAGGNDFCDVRDVAAGITTALDRGQTGRRYILGGEPLSYFEAFTMLADVAGRKGPVRVGRRPLMKLSGAVGDLWGKITGHEGDLNSAAIEIAMMPHHYTYARAAAELDYHPRPAREAAEAAWQWFLEYRYA
jgi:dihydroflavonol-4-reductase